MGLREREDMMQPTPFLVARGKRVRRLILTSAPLFIPLFALVAFFTRPYQAAAHGQVRVSVRARVLNSLSGLTFGPAGTISVLNGGFGDPTPRDGQIARINFSDQAAGRVKWVTG
jgi:hypothetical protein